MKTLLFPGLLKMIFLTEIPRLLILSFLREYLNLIFSLRNWSLDPSSRKWSRDDTALINKRKRSVIANFFSFCIKSLRHIKRSCSTPAQNRPETYYRRRHSSDSNSECSTLDNLPSPQVALI